MRREHDLETSVVAYLRTYHEAEAPPPPPRGASCAARGPPPPGRGAQQRRTRILDEYLTEMNQAPPKVALAARDECPRCEGTKFLLCSAKSIMSCPRCGYAVTFLDATTSSTSFDEAIDFSPYSYQRVNHWMSWLSLCQGKEAHRVPDDVLEKVMAELYHEQGITDAAAITQKAVRAALRKLRLRKAYDHVAQITGRLSGRKPLRIPPETEEKLRNMFLAMQSSFAKHAPKSRTNFLSYSYVLYRCFQILKLDHMLDGIALLKGRDKLEANDAIFRKMAADLGWPVYDLPPASATA